MNTFNHTRLASQEGSASSWSHVFLLLSLFCLVSQWSIPSGVRPFFLSAGGLTLFLAASALLLFQVARDRLLMTFVVAALLYWLLAFPPAINGNDDNTAYLIFAKDFYSSLEKTIQPLSERRIFSVGGLYALQAPVLHWIGQYGLSLVEPVFGLMLFFIILTSRCDKPDNCGCYFIIGLLALAPLAGSKVLANSSSTFVLSAFSFALLELGKNILQKRVVGWPQVALLVTLPLAAATIRPTTTPFNVLIAFLLVTVVFNKQQVTKIVTLGAVGLAFFFLAVHPYHEISGTYLYPVLGRGFHITAEGYSISGSLPILSHFDNFFNTVFFDPLFLTIGALVTLLVSKSSLRQQKAVLLIPYAVYLSFYFLIVVGTGGLASVRYVFPVSLALLTSLLLLFFDVYRKSICTEKRLLNRFLRAVWPLAILSGLIVVRFTAGPAVIEKRLKMYGPNDDQKSKIEAILNIVNKTPGSTLFVCTGLERFIVDKIKGRYFIMDQPGMLSPWIDKKTTYEQGLRDFLALNDIRSIVMTAPQCSAVNAEVRSYVGWEGLSSQAFHRNERAICNIIKEYNVQLVGSLAVATK